tara:strand:- start:939 stop:1469 length:531 start_codon:yes stop_codon:yes gene_type:complete
MDRVIKNIINNNLNTDDGIIILKYENNDAIDNLKTELFNSGIIYDNIDRTNVYDKLADIFVYAEEYNMTDTIIMWIKEEDLNHLFCLYALSVFDVFVVELIKDKYLYDREFIARAFNDIKDLSFDSIIRLYDAEKNNETMYKFYNDWIISGIKTNDTEVKWGLVLKIINSIDDVCY